MTGVEERVDRLEAAMSQMAQTVAQVSRDVQDVSREVRDVARYVQDVSRELRESYARVDAQWARFREQAEKDREQAEKDRERAEKDRQERERERKEFNTRMAELSDSMGTLVEDMVRPNAANIAAKIFGGDSVITIAQRVRRRHPTEPGRNAEVDLLAAGREHVMVVEAKRKISSEKIAEFVGRVNELKEFFPEYAGCVWISVVASVSIDPSAVTYLNRQKVYGVALADDTMELVNYGQF